MNSFQLKYDRFLQASQFFSASFQHCLSYNLGKHNVLTVTNIMRKLFLMSISVLFSPLMFSQDFEYTHKSSENHTLRDVLELDSTYLLVGGIEPFQPLYVWIDKKGNFIKDSLDTNGIGWQVKGVIERKSGGFVLVEQVDIRE